MSNGVCRTFAVSLLMMDAAARKCRYCGKKAANRKGPPTCAECRQKNVEADSKRPGRPMKIKTCTKCGKEFRSRSGYNDCNPCRFQAMKHPCARCGEPCDQRAQLCLSCHSATQPRGSENPNWRGGRVTKTYHGYVLVKAHDHPRARASGGFYVREHILVMERQLGRYLLPGETVHHKNGIKDDNRPENLEVWTKSQPAGQRASDLVIWAKEILELYGELVNADADNPTAQTARADDATKEES